MAAKGRLLVVEDDRALVELLVYHFEREEFDVEHTPDGEEALIMARESPPDLVILDWMLEGLSGIEVCRQLRRIPETANVPIIMLTARGEEGDRIRGFETGADDYVTKPFSPARARRAHDGGAPPGPPGPGRRAACLCGHRDGRGRPQGEARRGTRRARSNRIPPAPPFPRTSRPGLFARAIARFGLGPGQRDRTRTVDVHIRRLRKAINAGQKSDIIRTVRSAGYALDAEGHR